MPSEARSWRDAASNVAFALALTAVMGAALFVTVGANPKADTYSNLPWYYAGGCAVAAVAFHRLGRRLDRPAPAGVPAGSERAGR